FQLVFIHFQLHVIYFLKLIEEPWIDCGHLRELLHRVSMAYRVTYVVEPLRMWSDMALSENLRLDAFGPHFFPGIERADSLHQSFSESAPDRHDLADRLHLRTQALVRSGKFLKLPLGYFYDDVV